MFQEIWLHSFIYTSRNRSNAKTISKLKELKTQTLCFSVDDKKFGERDFPKKIFKPEEKNTGLTFKRGRNILRTMTFMLLLF